MLEEPTTLSRKVMLTDEDRKAAKWLARKRNDKAITDRIIDKHHSTLEVDYYGALGEIAVAKILHVNIVHDTALGGDEGYDFIWNNKRISVRYTFRGTHLLVDYLEKESNADIHILVKGSDQEMNVIGYLRAREINTLAHRHPDKFTGRGVDENRLHNIESLLHVQVKF